MGDSDGFPSEQGWEPRSRVLNSFSRKPSRPKRPKEEEEEEAVYTFTCSWSNMVKTYKPKKQFEKIRALRSRWAPYLHSQREELPRISWFSTEKELERYQNKLLEMFLNLKAMDHLHASPWGFIIEGEPGFSSQDQACRDHQSSAQEGVPATTTQPWGPSTSDLSGAEACEALDAFKRLSVSASTSVGPEEGDLEDADK